LRRARRSNSGRVANPRFRRRATASRGSAPTAKWRSPTIASGDGGGTWKGGTVESPFKVRGTADAPLWSPDGTRLAIVNGRGDHAFVAIYALGAKSIAFAAPGFGSDGSAAWSADGSKIAFLRLPGSPADLTAYDDPARYAPWSIVVADAATGKGGVVWRAPPGRGSEFTIADGVQPLWWSKDGDLAFVWERDGWRHLYALRGVRGDAAPLDAGRVRHRSDRSRVRAVRISSTRRTKVMRMRATCGACRFATACGGA
jgi:hypothetical protein